MKKTRVTCIIAAMWFIATGAFVSLRADDKDNAAIIDMLTSGDWWHFSGQHWSNYRMFYKNGTMLEYGHNPNMPVPWKISGNKIIIEFNDYEDTLLLPLDPKGTKGLDRYGTEFTAVRVVPKDDSNNQQAAASGAFGSGTQSAVAAHAATPAPQTVAPETQQKADDLVKTYHDSLLMVTGGGGNGSGFIATMSGTNYLVTNAHVMAAVRQPAFKNLEDQAIPAGNSGVAVGADIFRLQTQGGKPFEIMQNVDQNAAIGDEVAVPGNAEGAGVVNTIMGKIVGIGPSLVEVDAQFVPGNSGSPIVHLKSGKVIGIATFLSRKEYDASTQEKIKTPVTRYFGYRIDCVKTWQPVNWQVFYAQADAIQKLNAFSTSLDGLYLDLRKNGHATPGLNTDPQIKDQIDDWIKDRQHSNADDAQRTDEMFVSFLKNATQTDVGAVQPYITYDYFRNELIEIRQIRAEMSAAFEKLILHKQ